MIKNYLEMNEAVVFGREFIGNSSESYKYMLRNNVANYYARHIDRNNSGMKQKILADGDIAKKRYIKTLQELYIICKKNRIPFLLFKTYKYIDEPVFNDIDIIVHEKDFHWLLELLESEGYACEEDEPLKGKCIKKNFLKIEPRVSVSFHGYVVFTEKEIWKNVENVRIGGIDLQKTTRELDVVSLLLNIIYGPNYCKLYLFKIVSDTDLFKMKKVFLGSRVKQDMELLLHLLKEKSVLRKKFPFFLPNIYFLKFWIARIYYNQHMSMRSKIKHLVFFFYIKYKFILFDSLHFEFPTYEK